MFGLPLGHFHNVLGNVCHHGDQTLCRVFHVVRKCCILEGGGAFRTFGEIQRQDPGCLTHSPVADVLWKTHPFTGVEDLERQGQSCTRHHRRREVDHLVVGHGELQKIFCQRVLLSRHLGEDDNNNARVNQGGNPSGGSNDSTGCLHTSQIFEARRRNCRGRGRPSLNFSTRRIFISISLI